MSHLNDNIKSLSGIGDKRAEALARLGVSTIFDLISHFPRAYEDRTQFRPIEFCSDGETVCIEAMARTEPSYNRVRAGMELVKIRVVDDTAMMDITFFNQSYVKNQLRKGETYCFYGTVKIHNGKKTMINPSFEPSNASGSYTGRIVPLYPLTAGISQNQISSSIKLALDKYSDEIEEVLPSSILRQMDLVSSKFAYENIHVPEDFESLELARRRLIFEELFILSCTLKKLRRGREIEAGILMQSVDFNKFYDNLPFSPTKAQNRAIREASIDMCYGKLMNRLVQGDVGSGKTLVAAALMWQVYSCGHQSAFMAPTEILAEQHLATLTSFLAPHGINVMKLTGSMSAAEKREVKEKLKNGDCHVLVGTHAIIGVDVDFKDLALVITDEQHRFGVKQRTALSNKSANPHVLLMSATPIPRSLALIIYGELDISVLDERPPNRKDVDTFAVDERYRQRLNAFIDKLVHEGRQAFVVCPMIDENEELSSDLKPVETHYQTLKSALPHLRFACLHGKMKAADKEAIMADFVAGDIDVLVSTTVIEVGVDVPNAALIIIENAERFGLSQLHQLRGRVGRGEHQSYCILVSDHKGEDSKARLKIMTETNDGFLIADHDLKLRGPGDFFGSRQHGLPSLKLANFYSDNDLLQKAQYHADILMKSDPNLRDIRYSALKSRIDNLILATDSKLN